MKQSKTNFVSMSTLLLILTASGFLLSFSLDWKILATTASDSDEESEIEPVELISTIRNLLNQTLVEYNKQNYTGASSLADIAYIDNFEFIEAPLAEQNEQLMEETELMLREDLGGLIEERVPVQQVQQHIDQINERLDQAEQILSSQD